MTLSPIVINLNFYKLTTIDKMRYGILFGVWWTLTLLLAFGCSEKTEKLQLEYEIPTRNHDLSYIPFDVNYDDPSFIICDSTSISSGRNRLQYIGGKNNLINDIISNYKYNQKFKSYTGYIVIRFLVNCEGNSGRYRADPLHLDFSPQKATADLLDYSIEIIKSLDHWKKSSPENNKKEYSKYINLKIENGQIQHVLL